MKHNWTLVTTLMLVGLLISMRGYAQTGSDQWRFSLTPYLWLPSMDGTLRYGPPKAGGGSPNVEVSAEDLLSALDFAFMLSGDARKGRWSVAVDFMYIDLSADKSSVKSVDFNAGAGPVNIATAALNLDTEVEMKGSIWTLVGGYTLVQEPRVTLDVIAGFRYTGLEATTSFELATTVTGPPGSVTFERTGSVKESVDIWDAIVGVRGRFKLGDSNWFVPYHFDVGGGDSKLTWQAVVGVAYSYKWGDLGLVYRHLSYEQGGNKLVKDLTLSGPALGASFRF